MKYVVLILGFIIIGIWRWEDLTDNFIGFIAPLFFWLIWSIIWLIVFFVFDLQLPKVTI